MTMTMNPDINENEVHSKFMVRTKGGRLLRLPVTYEYVDGRIEFTDSPFELKDEIKAMMGSKWHGHDSNDGRKIWSVDDTARNRFQIAYLEHGDKVYAWFDRDLIEHTSDRPLMDHQYDLIRAALTYRYQIWAAEMGTGKTLSAIEVMERTGIEDWWWIGPKPTHPQMELEFEKWDCKVKPTMFTYRKFVDEMKPLDISSPVPCQGVIFDECSWVKNPTADRSKAAQLLTDMIRRKYEFDGCAVLMSGTPSPKKPSDWWSLAEIAWPGFLREGSEKALWKRLSFTEKQTFQMSGYPVDVQLGWRDSEKKCDVCGFLKEHSNHDRNLDTSHKFVPAINEVELLGDRMKGLRVVKLTKDCLTLPDKRYREIRLDPSPSMLRAAKALVEVAPNAMTGMTWLRELSDGFQYREVENGITDCTVCNDGRVDEWFDPDDPDRVFRSVDMLDESLVGRLEKHQVECFQCNGTGKKKSYKRIAKHIPCPKDKALRDLLDENEEVGRIVVFAGFTGSVDRCTQLCLRKKWDVVRLDGRGYQVSKAINSKEHEDLILEGSEPLKYWANRENERVAFVCHPESGGMGLNLVEARTAVYWSNSFKPEFRTQSEARIHRKGMDENLGCTIVDLIHLPTDERTLEIIRDNRKLELMTMGEITYGLAL